MDRRDFIKVAGGSILLATSSSVAFQLLTETGASWTGVPKAGSRPRWGMVIDLTKCPPDCTACIDACRLENNVAFHHDERWDIYWIRKVTIEKELGSEESRRQILLLCNHCDKPPCAQVCPVQATYKRDDGIVIVDHHRCIGCRYCVIACPYNARYFNFKDIEDWANKDRPKRSHGVAEACTLCAHRLDQGQMPACVEACFNVGGGALYVGDLNDPDSNVSRLIAENAVKRLRDDLGTEPKVHYIGL